MGVGGGRGVWSGVWIRLRSGIRSFRGSLDLEAGGSDEFGMGDVAEIGDYVRVGCWTSFVGWVLVNGRGREVGERGWRV